MDCWRTRTEPRYEISLAKIRDRKETMQFLKRGKYVAVVADGKVHLCPEMQEYFPQPKNKM